MARVLAVRSARFFGGFSPRFTLVAALATAVFASASFLRADSFDWRNVNGYNYVTPVKSQFGGTCWAFASTASLESKYMLTRNDTKFVPNLSEQQLVWETNPDMGGTGGGDPMGGAHGYFISHGLVSETECPANPGTDQPDGDDPWPLSPGWTDRVWKATSWTQSVATSVQHVKDMLRTNGPMTIVMSSGEDWYDPAPGLPGGGHAVLLVGYQDDAAAPGGGYWIVKNSWGSSWNDAGYGAIAYSVRPRYAYELGLLDGPVYYSGAMATATWKGGSGNWRSTGSLYWTAGGANYAWENKETQAVFNSAGGNVNVYGPVIAHGMTFAAGATGYSFALANSTAAVTVTAGGLTTEESLAFQTPVSIGAPQTWTVAAGKTVTLNRPLHTLISDLTLGGAGDVVVNDVIDGGGILNSLGARPGAVIKANTGSLTLTGVSYDNDFTLQSGTLYVTPAGGADVAFGGAISGAAPTVIHSTGTTWFGQGSGVYTGSITRSAGGALGFSTGEGERATFSGAIDGSGDVIQNGPGTTVLYGVNTYTGATRIQNGALQARFGQGIPAASFVSLEGGVLQSTGTTIFARNLGTSGEAFQWSGPGGGFAAGAGTMIVNVNGGTDAIDWGDVVGQHLVGTLMLGSTSSLAKTEFQNSIRLNGATRTVQVLDNRASSSDYSEISGVVSGSGAGLDKTGDGTLVLSKYNTYDGTTTVRSGVLQADSGVGLPQASHLVLDGGVVQGNNSSGVTFRRTLSATPGADTFCLGPAGGGFSAGVGPMTVRVNDSTDTITWGDAVGEHIVGTLTLGSRSAKNTTTLVNGLDLGSAVRTLCVDDNSSTTADYAILSGPISGAAGSGLVKSGLGKLQITGTQGNTYSGTTTVLGGDVELNKSSGHAIPGDLILGGGSGYHVRLVGANQMPSTAKWIWDHTPVSDFYQEIELLGHNTTVAGIVDASEHAVIENATSNTSVGACVLTVNNNDDCLFQGRIRNGGSGVAALGLAKSGTGTLTFDRDHLSYTGPTTISAGTVVLQDCYNFASSTVVNNGRFEIRNYFIESTFSRPISGSGQTVLSGNQKLTLGGQISGAGSLIKRGTAVAVVQGRKYYSGGTFVYDGELRLNSPNGLAVRGDVSFVRLSTPEGTYRTLSLAGNDQLESTAEIHFAPQAIVHLGGYSTTLGGLDYASSGTVAAAIENGATTGLSTLTLDVADSESYVYYGAIRDTTSGASGDANQRLALVKKGTGTQAIQGSLYSGQFTGGLTVMDGVLDYSAGTLPNCQHTISGGALRIGSQSKTIPGLLITGGSLDGSGSFNSLSDYDVQGGTVNVQLTGSRGLVKSGSAAATLTNTNPYNGGTSVLAGTLVATTPGALGSAGRDIAISGGATLQLTTGTLDVTSIATLTNHGVFDGSLAVGGGGEVLGEGAFGPVAVNSLGVFSPGDGVGATTTGPAAWNPGGEYRFELSDADATAGSGWDLWNIDGALTIDAPAESESAFTIRVTTLAGESAGPMADFDNTQAYSWLLASTAGPITGFGNLALDVSEWLNMLGAEGGLYLAKTGDRSISLNHDPGTLAPGDANGDGQVNDVDAARLASHWLASEGVGWLEGDFTHDGRVDDRDAAILAAHWTRGADQAPVPEPSALALLLSLLVAVGFVRRKRS